MVLVIADTSPIRYLVQIGHIDLLHRLFAAVSIPTEVARELGDPPAPAAVQAWIQSPPGWLRVLDAVGDDDPAQLPYQASLARSAGWTTARMPNSAESVGRGGSDCVAAGGRRRGGARWGRDWRCVEGSWYRVLVPGFGTGYRPEKRSGTGCVPLLGCRRSGA